MSSQLQPGLLSLGKKASYPHGHSQILQPHPQVRSTTSIETEVSHDPDSGLNSLLLSIPSSPGSPATSIPSASLALSPNSNSSFSSKHDLPVPGTKTSKPVPKRLRRPPRKLLENFKKSKIISIQKRDGTPHPWKLRAPSIKAKTPKAFSKQESIDKREKTQSVKHESSFEVGCPKRKSHAAVHDGEEAFGQELEQKLITAVSQIGLPGKMEGITFKGFISWIRLGETVERPVEFSFLGNDQSYPSWE
ncbi:hypothetical protein BP5796_00569 [Coleophoma crateriformis]|uniref:Uncharacterized protein n=1 Tax=Coleophoma crateriformis TaxID=565419 RepID=A0A3D8T8D8_9HELO|nr:hypothetical protein BP5796_00569 [Coleophoma crateriformis]